MRARTFRADSCGNVPVPNGSVALLSRLLSNLPEVGAASPSGSSPEVHRQPHRPDWSRNPATEENEQSSNRVWDRECAVACEKTEEAQPIEGRESKAEPGPTARKRSLLERQTTRPIGAETGCQQECAL